MLYSFHYDMWRLSYSVLVVNKDKNLEHRSVQ